MVSSRLGFPSAFLLVFTGCHHNSPAAVLAPLPAYLTQLPTEETSQPQYLAFGDKLTATVFESLRQDPHYKIVPNGTPFVCPSKMTVGAQGYLLRARVIKMRGDSAIASITLICSTAAQTTSPTQTWISGQSQMWSEDFLLVRRGGKWQVDKRLNASVMMI